MERSRSDNDMVGERPAGRLLLGIHPMPHWPALHEDDGMVTILPNNGGREARHIPGLGTSGPQLELRADR